ncbi:DUF4149 domain-containing protein [Fontivita pretiosa]|uniref:DUF4149 domain-containing protein n=1 Tax=Fontivita pretiosa TaxID=2989684 RepID=UPI003D163978
MFQAIQIAYWLALSTWFGGVLFIAVAAPVIFRTVREADPTLPKVLSVNLEGQHSTLLAGTIVGNLLAVLSRIQLLCAGVLFVAILGQWFYIDRHGAALLFPLIRTAIYLAAVALVIYDWRVVWPRIQKYRQQYIDHADEPEIANPAKEQFDRYHMESITVLRNVLFLLLGMILFSANIRPAPPPIPL